MAKIAPPKIGGYSRTKTREQSAGMVRKPNLLRLEAALHMGHGMAKGRGWIFDAKVFSAVPESDPNTTIGNLPGYMASLDQMRVSNFRLQPMGAGIAIVGTHMLRGSLSHPGAIPPHFSPDVRWRINNVSWTCGGAETFGWHAVCEYFSLGMWDARRIFQGYGYPSIPTLEATLAYLEQFVKLRRKDLGE